jgi:hypothetical protein
MYTNVHYGIVPISPKSENNLNVHQLMNGKTECGHTTKYYAVIQSADVGHNMD